MILTRLGNKQKLSQRLYKEFPDHKMRIELFFGAGGSFFHTPIPRYSILNDYDDDVANLYKVIKSDSENLKTKFQQCPISESLIKHWKLNHETDPVMMAVRFLMLSNFTYLAKGDTLRIGLANTKQITLNSIDNVFKKLENSIITNKDFRDVLLSINFSRGLLEYNDCFVYLDPIYLNTIHTYRVPKWTKKDTIDCFELMKNCGMRCAMSEFDNIEVVELAKHYSFNIIPLVERKNIKTRSTEILITNYKNINLFT